MKKAEKDSDPLGCRAEAIKLIVDWCSIVRPDGLRGSGRRLS